MNGNAAQAQHNPSETKDKITENVTSQRPADLTRAIHVRPLQGSRPISRASAFACGGKTGQIEEGAAKYYRAFPLGERGGATERIQSPWTTALVAHSSYCEKNCTFAQSRCFRISPSLLNAYSIGAFATGKPRCLAFRTFRRAARAHENSPRLTPPLSRKTHRQ